MAGLDPYSELHTSLGRGSLAGKQFKDGGGFIAEQLNPAQTQEEADAQHAARVKRYDARHFKLKAEAEAKGEPPPPYNPPKKPELKQAAPSGASFEFHRGGGEHSNKIPPSKAMGGAYFKVEPKSNDNAKRKKGTSNAYRVARYGEFTTGAKTGRYWDSIPAKGTEGK